MTIESWPTAKWPADRVAPQAQDESQSGLAGADESFGRRCLGSDVDHSESQVSYGQFVFFLRCLDMTF